MAGSCEGWRYREEDIQVLTELEQIRLRPAMYLGGTDTRSLHHMLFELVRGSLEEVALGHGNSVRVTLHEDGSAEVADDRVPPTEVEFTFARPGTGGHNDLSYAIANAVSAELSVTARSPGSRYYHSFRRGVTHAVLQSGGPDDDRGLTVRFRPDPDIFGTARFDSTTIRDRLRQYAFLHSGVRITFSDEAADTLDEFEYADGRADDAQHDGHDKTHRLLSGE